jgi:6-phosphogluconolactonase
MRQMSSHRVTTRFRKRSAIARALLLAVALPLLVSCNVQSTHLAYVTTGGGIVGFRIRNGNGNINSVLTSPFQVGDSANGIVVHPSSQFALVANQTEGTISLLEIDHVSGVLTEKLPRTPAGANPGPMLLDPSGAFLYVADQGLNQVLVFSVSSSGTLSPVSSVSLAAPPSSLTLASNGFLFVPVTSISDVYVFTVSSGVLTQVCFGGGPVCLPFNVANGVGSVAVDPAGKFLYATSPATNTVSGFVIGAGGTLTPVPGVIFGTGTAPAGALVDPTGKFLYVANSGAGTLSEYTINTSSGDLTAFTTSTQSVGTGPQFITFDPVGNFLYVADSRSVSQFLLLSNGVLFGTNNSLQVGATPRALALTK